MTSSSVNRAGGTILTSVLWIIFFLVLAAFCVAHAEQQHPAKATTFGYVANGFDDTVSVFAADNNTVVATIPVGGFPEGVAATPDGSRVYVTNAFDNSVSVINTAKKTVVATIAVGANPVGVAITSDGTHAYVANQDEGTVSVIETASNKVVATILMGSTCASVAITPDPPKHGPFDDNNRRHKSFAFVTDTSADTVAVIDTTSNKVVATVPVGVNPFGVAITPDGTKAYVTNLGTVSELETTVSVIDIASNTVVATIPVGKLPKEVAITPDGKHVYETNTIDNTVSEIDTASNALVATVPVGLGPSGVAIQADEAYSPKQDDRRHPPLAYVTNISDNTVTVIDTTSNKVVATIPVGNTPFAIAFATVTPSHHNSEQ